MCGIAGIIYRDGSEHAIGNEMTRMLQAMKHRGPDSTGYALYGKPENGNLVMRYKLADANTPRDFEFEDRLRRHRIEVEARLSSLGARINEVEEETPYAFRVAFDYDGDLKLLADFVEDIPEAEVLSLGHSLEIVKDLGDAESVHETYGLADFTGTHAIGHVRMATESEVDIAGAHPYWAYPYSDVAVVHNGQLTNYFMWRRRLERAGRRFMSECDSEIIAVYLAEEMSKGSTLRGGDAQVARRARRRLHVHRGDEGRARRREGRARCEAARPLRIRRSRRARVRGDRDPPDRRPRDRHVRPLRARGARVAAVGERQIAYDARGLAEPIADAPRNAVIEDGVATFDARDLTTRTINLELRRLLYEEGIDEVVIQNPQGRHSLGVGILRRCKITFEGSLGYFACGLIDGPEIHIKGRVGWSSCENMMSGVVVVDKNGGSLTGAAMRGGDLVVKGRVGARTGIDQKGGTIIIGGSVGSMTGFMMQRGRQIICGDAGPGLGDSMYDGTIYVAGKVKSLGIDCVPGEWTDADTELIERKFRIYGLGSPPEFQKFVCGKVLYNYDSLEPSEKKLVI